MPYITVGKENSGNIDLYYEDHGSGDPVILIHGWPLSGASWEKQVPVLLEAGCRVITYDRRGFGASSRPTSGYDYDTFAADLNKLIIALDLSRVTLAGFSMGGGEVARYIGQYGTGRVSRAILISAVTPYLLKLPDNPEGVDGTVFDGIKHAIRADRPAFLTRFLSDFYNFDVLGGKRVSDEVRQYSWNVAVAASAKATLDCVSAWTTDFRKDLQRIDIPTLVLHGDSDRILPFSASGKRTHEFIKGSRLVTVEGGPHGITWTHSDIVNRELADFVGRRLAARK